MRYRYSQWKTNGISVCLLSSGLSSGAIVCDLQVQIVFNLIFEHTVVSVVYQTQCVYSWIGKQFHCILET